MRNINRFAFRVSSFALLFSVKRESRDEKRETSIFWFGNLLFFLYVLIPSFAFAGMGNTGGQNPLDATVLTDGNGVTSDPTPAPPSLRRKLSRWMANPTPAWEMDFAAGAQFMRAGAHTDASPALSLTIRAEGPGPRAEGSLLKNSPNSELGARAWGLELGGTLPHQVSGIFQTASQSVGASDYSAHIESFYEVHAAGVYSLPHGGQTWVVPEVSLGVSMVHFSDRVDQLTTETATFTSGGQTFTFSFKVPDTQSVSRYGVSPLARLGVVVFPESLFSLRADLAYVDYGNTAHAFGQTFDLGMSGWLYRALVAMKL